MSFYDLYVGDPNTCTWDGHDWAHFNLPKGIVHLGNLGLGGCTEAHGLITSEKYGGRQLDWGATGARLNKRQIVEFLTEFPDCPFLKDDWRRASIEKVQKGLEDDKVYALVAYET